MTNLVVVIISTFGLLSSIFTLILNSFMVSKSNVWKKSKTEMNLFFYRFILDILLGFFIAIYLGLIIVYCYDPAILDHRSYLMFLISLPASNIGAMRSIITLCITIERCLAAYTPIFFHNSHKNFPKCIIPIVAITFGCFEDLMLFVICEFDLIIQEDCVVFGCAINTCFRTYWSYHKTTIFALTGIFSILLCIKLFVLGSGLKNKIARVNRLALLDTATVTIFDFLPSLISASQWNFLSFQNIGPYSAVTKLFGCAIESYIVSRTLFKNQRKWIKAGRSVIQNRLFKVVKH